MSVRRAILWCAGAVEPGLLDDLPTERTRYVSLGLALLIPPLLALLGMGATVYSLTRGDWRLGVLAGISWAVIVFIVDRGLVLTIKGSVPSTGWRHEIARQWRIARGVLVRFGLAALFGAIISHMAILLVFQEEITEKLGQETRAKTAQATEATIEEVAALREEEKALRERRQRLADERAALQIDLAEEDAGVGMSNPAGDSPRFHEGKGPVWHGIAAALEARRKDLEDTATALQTVETRVQAATQRLAKAQETARGEVAMGYMARARALEALTARSAELRRDHRVLFAFFVVIELIPVLLKAMIVGGPYATRIAMQEWIAIEDERVRLEALNLNHATRVRVADAAAFRDTVSGLGGLTPPPVSEPPPPTPPPGEPSTNTATGPEQVST